MTMCSRGCVDECQASLVFPCPADTELRQYGTEPAVPAAYTSADDVNPICGCHRRSQCRGCGGCTSCDGCYCGED